MKKKEWEAYHAEIEEDALDFLADIAGGDARCALNAVELGYPHDSSEVRMERSILRWRLHPNVFRNG